MKRDNYAIQVEYAKERFRSYDPDALCSKLGRPREEGCLCVTMLNQRYRIRLADGDLSRLRGEQWVDANSFAEVLTLLDLICDSREDRHPTGNWKNMRDFGHGFHQSFLEQRDPWAERFQEQPEMFAKACEALGGEKYPLGDVAYSIPVFDDLRVLIQLWFGDEEFPAQLRYLWDENALQYLKYETMFYAVGVIQKRIAEGMEG